MQTNSQDVLSTPNNNTIFMVWNFKNGVDCIDTFKSICALVINLNNTANTRFPDKATSVVLGIGFDAWKKLDLSKPLPKEFVKFEAIEGTKHTAVSTPGDLHFHIRSEIKSYCIDIAQNIADALNNVADCIEEIHGFKYWDGRSILGFVDGTENPRGEDRTFFGIIGDEDKTYKGGSYLFVQKYKHDMNAWKALPVQAQENVIGRTKADDIEMDDDTKPSNSHAALANVGDDLKIVRNNLPFGSIANNNMGTYFIAYASKFSTIKLMLENMYLGNPKGNYDRILDFSTAETGTLFFVPTINMLKQFSE
ncbi:MAG: Dyp-type peroxidase [Sphingobacteriales bacterium]|nr:MAG: Dyp-type peroxidase [Sphingobacteriales bacterium]